MNPNSKRLAEITHHTDELGGEARYIFERINEGGDNFLVDMETSALKARNHADIILRRIDSYREWFWRGEC